MYNILITGGAGYIGSVLVPELLRQGHKITVIDNLMYRQITLLECCGFSNFEFIDGDVRNEKLIASLMSSADIIIPLACIVGFPACERDPYLATKVNLDAIKMLLNKKSKEQRIIFPTTNSGYGVGQKGIECDENTPLNPISHYGRLKVEAERIILDHPNSITFRLATIFGISPRMRMDLLINDFTYRATRYGHIIFYEGHFKRNFIHILDVVRAFVYVIENFESMQGEAYNVGLSGVNLDKFEMCAEIKKQVPNFIYREDDVGSDPDKRDYIISNDKIEKIGFRAIISLQKGIAELVKGYKIIKLNQFTNL